MLCVNMKSIRAISRSLAWIILAGLFSLAWSGPLSGAELPDIHTVPPDLIIPALTDGPPAAGKRCRQTIPEFATTKVYHVLYLPRDWQAGKKYPVIAEYAGNGRYTNRFGDVSLGWPENSRLGYGISGGEKMIWICLPYICGQGTDRSNTNLWWGDAQQTVAYCKAAMSFICREYGGDTNRLVLTGFSRGAIGCNYLGLHDDEIAGLWRAFIPHSHYDGVNPNWKYPEADRASARQRLLRLKGRPQFISQEGTTTATAAYLKETGIDGHFTFQPLPYRNHTDEWVLRNIPERQNLRRWLEQVLNGK